MKYKLKDICTKITDGSHNPPSGIQYSQYLMLSSKNIADDSITFDNPRYLTEDDFITENKRTNIQLGDLLLTIVGTVGRVAVVSATTSQICLQRSVAVLKPRQDIVNSRYLMYHLQYIRPTLEAEAKGVAQKGIYLKQVENIEVSIPAITTQIEIINTLDTVSELISLRKQQLLKLDELVKSRFVELFGDPITNSKQLPMEQMGLRFNLKAGITTAADDIHDFEEGVYEIPCYGGNGIRGYVKEKSYTGDYPIIGRQGALCGNVQYATGDFHATEHAVLVSLLKTDNSVWVYHLLKLMDLYRYHTGAAQPGLAVKTLNTVEVIVADKSKQDQFAAFVEQTGKSKLEIQKSLEKLETLKKALMQKYFG